MGQNPVDADRREEQVVDGMLIFEERVQLHGKLCHGLLQYGFGRASVLLLAELRCFVEVVARRGGRIWNGV